MSKAGSKGQHSSCQYELLSANCANTGSRDVCAAATKRLKKQCFSSQESFGKEL